MPAHQLVHAEVQDAPPIDDVLPAVERQLRGNVLLVHHRAIDVAFLQEACRRTGVRWPGPRVVDTVDLLVRAARRARFTSPDQPQDRPVLNLSAAREAWGLPPELVARADEPVAVPIYGRAESLNLAAAAAVCLYTSARAQRAQSEEGTGRPVRGQDVRE